MEQIYDAIKLKQMDKFVLYISSIDLSDEEQIEPILYRSIKANNIAAFDHIINKSNYFSYYFIRKMFGTHVKEPFTTSLLHRIDTLPSSPQQYGCILAWTGRFHRLDQTRISYLVNHPVLDWYQRIKDQRFLCRFVYVFMVRVRTHRVKTIRPIMAFLEPYVPLESILAAIIMIGKKSYIPKKVLKDVDLEKMVQFEEEAPYGFSWYNDAEHEDESIPMKEVPFGTIL